MNVTKILVTLKIISRHALRQLDVILYVFYELNGVNTELTCFLHSFVKRIQNDVQYDVMRDAK